MQNRKNQKCIAYTLSMYRCILFVRLRPKIMKCNANIYSYSDLILSTVGFRPQIPHMLDGIRMLPPMSLPIPMTEPPPAMRAASPPEEPPGPRVGSSGFTVRP